jgi:hypothetical protein
VKFEKCSGLISGEVHVTERAEQCKKQPSLLERKIYKKGDEIDGKTGYESYMASGYGYKGKT